MKVGRRTIRLTSPDKELWPDDGITKRELAEHFVRVAPRMVPLVKDRPVTMHSFPGGIDGPGYMTKEIPKHFPDWVKRVKVAKRGGEVTHPLANDAASLAYLAGQNCVVVHVWLSRRAAITCPDRLIFDFDPSGSDFEPVRQGALAAGELLRELGLAPYAMTTGSRGLHVTVPLRPSAEFDEVRAFSRAVAGVLVERSPDTLTIEQRKSKRDGKVFVDTYRNAYAQHAVAPYSPRALAGAPVATPLHWEEVAEPDLSPRRFHLRDFETRLAEDDPWHGIARRAKALGNPVKRLERIARNR
jgi:bifunctional non-homologous end joining protein LigD